MTVPCWALCSCTTAPESRPTSATLRYQPEQVAQPVPLVPQLSEKGLGFIDTVASEGCSVQRASQGTDLSHGVMCVPSAGSALQIVWVSNEGPGDAWAS